MSLKDETPDTGRDAEGFKICLLTRAVERRRFNASKQYAVAMTSQLYSKPIENRKQIENINALVGHVVSSVTSPWTCSVSWDWMVDRVKVKVCLSIKPSYKISSGKDDEHGSEEHENRNQAPHA